MRLLLLKMKAFSQHTATLGGGFLFSGGVMQDVALTALLAMLASLLLVWTAIGYKFGSNVAGWIVEDFKNKDNGSMVVNTIILVSVLGINLSLMALIGEYFL